MSKSDFAKIIRASTGQQVLIYKEVTEAEGNSLHIIVNFDEGQSDAVLCGIPDEKFSEILCNFSDADAAGFIAEAAPFFEGG